MRFLIAIALTAFTAATLPIHTAPPDGVSVVTSEAAVFAPSPAMPVYDPVVLVSDRHSEVRFRRSLQFGKTPDCRPSRFATYVTARHLLGKPLLPLG